MERSGDILNGIHDKELHAVELVFQHMCRHTAVLLQITVPDEVIQEIQHLHSLRHPDHPVRLDQLLHPQVVVVAEAHAVVVRNTFFK